MADLADREYETDERGERVLVRSIESSHPVFLRFRNLTSQQVDIWWRDYDGKKRLYVRLAPVAYYDINTFAMHPWEFSDSRTKERYVVNNQKVYRAPRSMSTQYRTNWNITIGVRTLRHTALLQLATTLKEPSSARQLDLPKSLVQELSHLIGVMNTKEQPLPVN